MRKIIDFPVSAAAKGSELIEKRFSDIKTKPFSHFSIVSSNDKILLELKLQRAFSFLLGEREKILMHQFSMQASQKERENKQLT